jgi:hypothetical protein
MTCPAVCSRVCFFCDVSLSPRHEHDHYPVPQRHGGTETVPTCLNCHDLKDRVPLAGWPSEVLAPAMEQAGPLGRVLLAKLAALTFDATNNAA